MAPALRAAVVGAGLMGRWHADAIRHAGGTLVAGVDLDASRAVALGAPASFRELGAALQATHVDVVHVCAPLGAHETVAREALASGAHVVIEKPVAPDAERTRAILDAAQAAGRLLVPVHQFLFQRGVRRALAQRGLLGELVDVAYTAATAGADGSGLDPDELVDDVLPHPLALAERLLGGTAGAAWAVARPARGELRAATTLGSTSLTIAISARGRPTRNELVLTGTRATVHADLYHGFSVVERGPVSRARKVVRPLVLGATTVAAASLNLARRAAGRQTAYPGLRELVAAVYESIRDGAPAPISPAETLAVAQARDAVLGR